MKLRLYGHTYFQRLSLTTLLLVLLPLFAFSIAESEQYPNTSTVYQPSIPQWHFFSAQFKSSQFVYTPFFIESGQITAFSGGRGAKPGNGVRILKANINDESNFSIETLIEAGPDLLNYNYFRAVRVARSGKNYWMLAEVSGCYTGCDSPQNPKSLAVYVSYDDGTSWTFIDYLKVNGERYIAHWFGHTGLIYNPSGSKTLNIKEPSKNRFITIGEQQDILVSTDGVNYQSIPIKHPFPKDRLVFASIAKTPFGFHMMTCSNWSDLYYTTTVRHLFSKDLIQWHSLEANSFLKNPNFYKGVHLSYDEDSNKLWALSPCGKGNCDFLAWLEPQDFLNPSQINDSPEDVPVGEFVRLNGQTAMITSKSKNNDQVNYQVRFSSGEFGSGFSKEKMLFPLANYTRNGCVQDGVSQLCVGDTVLIEGSYASVMGYYSADPNHIKYALKFKDGVVDTGYTRSMFSPL